jgi:hypothetical protein
MPWKPEYAERRKLKAEQNPEYRKKRNEQSAKDKEARKEYMRMYYLENPEKYKKRTPEKQAEHNAKRRERYALDAEHREKKKSESLEWSRKNPEKRKQQRLSSTFGIDMSDFKDMLALQKNSCAICGHSDMSDPKYFPVVDHCHETGKIRGLLCMNCNQALGKFKDDTNRLFAAITYLSKNGLYGAT